MSGVITVTAQGNYLVDANGGVYENVNTPIANFPYFQRSTSKVNPSSGSCYLYTGKNFTGASGNQTGNGDLSAAGWGTYGPQVRSLFYFARFASYP